jgi:hypothetical protein
MMLLSLFVDHRLLPFYFSGRAAGFTQARARHRHSHLVPAQIAMRKPQSGPVTSDCSVLSQGQNERSEIA